MNARISLIMPFFDTSGRTPPPEYLKHAGIYPKAWETDSKSFDSLSRVISLMENKEHASERRATFQT